MQKLTPKTQMALLLAVLFSPFAGISAAGLLDNDLYGGSNASVNTSVNGEVDANAGADARLTGSSTVSEDEDELRGRANANANVGAKVETDEDAEIRINRQSAEVRGSAAARMAPFNVMTRSDLKAFAAGELQEDENLTHMNFNKENIEVGYKQPGKLLGLIPVTLNVRAIVASDGKVLIHYPWYRFLVITEKADVQAAIDAEVSSYLSTTTPITFTPGIQAELAARIMAILEANLISSGTATTTASE